MIKYTYHRKMRGVVGARLPTDEHHYTVLRVDEGEESAAKDGD